MSALHPACDSAAAHCATLASNPLHPTLVLTTTILASGLGIRGRVRGQRRPAHHRAHAECECRRPAVGRQRLFAAVKRAALVRRRGRGPLRAPPNPDCRNRVIRGRVLGLRSGGGTFDPARLQAAAGHWLRHAHAEQPGHSRPNILRRIQGTRYRHLGGHGRGHGRDRTGARRLAHRFGQLAGDFSSQSAARGRRSHPGMAGFVPRRSRSDARLCSIPEAECWPPRPSPG